MVDRDQVAKEKIERAVAMLKENKIDVWLFYTRLKMDEAIELLFNTQTKNEVMFLICKTGDCIAIASAEDAREYRSKEFFTQVIEVPQAAVEQAAHEWFAATTVRRLALNYSMKDVRCDGLSLGLYRKLERIFGVAALAQIKGSSYPMLEELRAVKTPGEIEIMKECSRLTTDIYGALFARVRVGMSEVDVAEIMMEECARRGVVPAFGDPPEYPMVLNPKGGMSHRGPSADIICRPGDMLIIDFSIRYNGYTSDIARTMYFLKSGETHAPQEIQDCANASIRAVGKIMESIKPGMKGYEVDAIGRGAIQASGYPDIPHSVGHQVGLEPHDGGTILGPLAVQPAAQGRLRESEIYALEPTVLQGRDKPNAIIEDNILLTRNGCELISKRQTSLIEIPYRN